MALAEAGAKIAPSTYHARHARPPSVRAVVEQELKAEIVRVHEANLGARKVREQLDRGGIPVARRRMERLMRQLGVAGAVRGKANCTTVLAEVAARPGDLVDRDLAATAPEPAVGDQPDLCRYRVRGRLHRPRLGRLLPPDRRLAASTSLPTDLADALELGLGT